MFKKINIIIVLLFIQVILCHAGDLIPLQLPKTTFNALGFGVSPALTKIGISSWATGGTGVAEMNLPSAVFSNPANLSIDRITLSTEIETRLETRTIFDFMYDGQYLLPSFVSISFPFENLNVAFTYLNNYDFHFEWSTPVTTESQPEGTGELMSFEKSIVVHAILGTIQSSLHKKISLGFSLGLNYLAMKEEIFGRNGSGNGLGMVIIGGITYHPIENFIAGMSIRYLTKIEYDMTYLVEAYPYKAQLPWILESGFSVRVSPSFSFLTSLEFQNWKDVGDGLDNQFQFHLGSIVNLDESNELRFGFFTQSDPSQNLGNYFDQNFLTGGFQTKNENLTFSLMLMDSHPFSNEEFWSSEKKEYVQFHQTIIMTGASYSF